MKRLLVAGAALVAALVTAAAPAAAADAQYYLSLGDSFAQGYQPIGGSHTGDGFNQGYADQLLKLVREPAEHLQLVKLGCGAETTTTMLFGGSPFCGYPGAQLAAATAFLRAHRGEVAFVTLDIGANDLINPDGGGDAAVASNLPVILSQLRDAAGEGVPIVGMSYFNPFVVEGAFASTDTTVVDGVPVDVARVCEWTRMCTPPPHGPDFHPNTAGYAAIAQAFAQALP